MREERLFNKSWEFIKLPIGSEYDDMAAVPDENWEKVVLPHDWLIYNTNDLYETSCGWYRKFIGVTLEEDRRYLLNFDGVYMNSTVYVNGAEVGTNRYGYSAFEYDITEFLNDGENMIAVQVRHESPNSRWYSGAGIFRDVLFKNVPKVHIATDGVYVSPKKINGRWVVIVDTEVEGILAEEQSEQSSEDGTLKYNLSYNIRLCKTNPGCAGTIMKPAKETVDFIVDDSSHGDNCAACGHPCASRGTVRVSDFAMDGMSATFVIDNPYVWDITNPNLYELHVCLRKGEEEIDSVDVKFGLREIEYTSDHGFRLNGRRVKIQGVCEHHDLGCLGAAFSKDAMRRKMLILKDMGVNAIRTSHNMPARGLMELADEMGIMIDSEAFDMWRRPKTEYDYARFFDENCHKDITSWIRRDRNHPSVIMWSIGNEIYDCHADESAVELAAKLRSYVEESDYLHNAPVTHASNFMPWEGAQKCTEKLALAGYNYGEKCYDEHHRKYPHWRIYGSETCSTVQSRGIYHFPLNVSVMADDDEQCSALGNCTTSWGAPSVEYVIKAERDREFSAGQFLWSGFDYIGEPTPYQTKNSYFGQIDTAGFPKDTYYIFKSCWTDVKKAPFVHVFPYWDFNEGQLIDVRVASNAPRVELFVNGESMGVKDIDHEHGDVLCPSWQVPYHRGFIEAVAYDDEGREIARQRRDSFGDVSKLKYRRFDFMGADRDLEMAEFLGFESKGLGSRLAFFEIYGVDSEDHEVENADSIVHVTVKNGTLLGLDNGDSTDFDQYKGSRRRLFEGRLLAVACADEGMDASDVEIEVSLDAEVPVRKIELVCTDGCALDSEKREVTVEAHVYPENATYRDDIIWAAVNDYAVETNLVELRPHGSSCTVIAKGDGSFRLRAMTHNGTDKIKCISSIEMSVTGMGAAFINPYEFVAGSLYTDSKGDVGNGNEKGVATPREGDSYIGYENIDFGNVGSDEVTLPIFTLDGNEYVIQIWEGRPGDVGSNLLCDGRYCKPSIWNTYQPETYKLNRRVKGVTSIYFTANAKYHLKGFEFSKPDKAFVTVNGADADHIYGDSFKIDGTAVIGIGNNVTLVYGGMDFGDRSASKFVICGSSPTENNSIHLKVVDNVTKEEKITLLEFSHSDGFEERSFDIPAVTGDKEVHLVFLPGSNFDLKYFRFE